jgi:hypothetical protein
MQTRFFVFSFQTLVHEMPGSHYIIEAEVCNEGVRYSDTFSLCIRYCLVQTSFTTTNLRVTALVRFSKPVNSLVRRKFLKIFFMLIGGGFSDRNYRKKRLFSITRSSQRFK